MYDQRKIGSPQETLSWHSFPGLVQGASRSEKPQGLEVGEPGIGVAPSFAPCEAALGGVSQQVEVQLHMC